ncbi:MAG: glycosyltransferase family 4 protein [Panacibacter sp.]
MVDFKEKKIIYITHYADLYGANRSLINLVEGLVNIGVKNILVILPAEGKICELLKKIGIEYRLIPFVNETYYAGEKPLLIKKIAKFFYNWYIVFRYSGSLKKEGKPIIHSNSSATLIGAYFSMWLSAPHVWHIREFGSDDYNLNYNFGYDFFNKWLNKAQAVIAVSKAVYEKRVKYCTAPKKKVIYNAALFSNQLSHEKQGNSNSKDREDGKIIFGIIGLINEEKNQEEAIDAFKLFCHKNKNGKLLIAGNGTSEYIITLQEKVGQYALDDKIKFTGFIENTNEFYNKIDCLLICSKHEAFGRVTIEAMGTGIPVIGYNNAGTSEIIKHGYNGLFYINGAIDLSEHMLMFAANKELRKIMGQNAEKTVLQNFTIEVYTKAVYNIYQSL